MAQPISSDPAATRTPAVSSQGVADFVDRLASTATAPGSGAAAAVALALAAGCVAKAFAISYRHTGASGLGAAADQVRSLAVIALEGAQRDGDDFRRWLGSHSAPAVDALRQDARALFGLSSVLRKLIEANRAAVIPTVQADLAAALSLIAAFEAIETQNEGELPKE